MESSRYWSSSSKHRNIRGSTLIALGCLIAFFLVDICHAKIPGGFTEINRLNVVREGGVIYLGTYGYNEGGICRVEVKHNMTDVSEPKNTGFFLKMVFNANQARMERAESQENVCTNSKAYFQGVIKLALRGMDASGHYEASAILETPGFYALFFYNCESKEVDLTATIIRYNVEKRGSDVVKHYLQPCDSSKPLIFSIFLLIQFGMLCAWVHRLVKSPKENRYRIHYIMGVVLLLFTACLIVDVFKYTQFDHCGKTSDVIHSFYGIFLILRGFLWVCVIVLLGTGWSIFKPFLGDREKKIIAFIVPLQLVVNIAQVVMEELSEGDASWVQWRDTLRIFDLICCCGVILPVIWFINHLRSSRQRDGKTLGNLIRLQQFRSLYITLVVYIYYSRIFVVVVSDTLPFPTCWISTVLQEFGTVAFLWHVGWKFRPSDQNPYLALDVEGLQREDVHTDLQMRDETVFSNEPHEITNAAEVMTSVRTAPVN